MAEVKDDGIIIFNVTRKKADFEEIIKFLAKWNNQKIFYTYGFQLPTKKELLEALDNVETVIKYYESFGKETGVEIDKKIKFDYKLNGRKFTVNIYELTLILGYLGKSISEETKARIVGEIHKWFSNNHLINCVEEIKYNGMSGNYMTKNFIDNITSFDISWVLTIIDELD